MITLKKIKSKLAPLTVMIAMLLSTTLSFGTGTTNLSVSNSGDAAKTEKAQAEVLISRIHEIASLNKKELSKEERGTLKKEVTTIKKELKELGGGVYISATLLVVILILIILL